MFTNKRVRIVFSTIILGLLLALIPVMSEIWHFPYLFVITLISYFLMSWSFKQYLYGIKLVTIFILPVMLTFFMGLMLIEMSRDIIYLGNYSDYKILIALLSIFLYGIVNYALILAMNVFNISEVRNIPLVRAAHTVGYLATIGVGILGYTTLYNLHQNLVVTTALVGVFSFLLYLQAFWQIELEEHLSRQVFLSTVASTLMTAQLGFVLGFWPLNSVNIGLSLTTSVYTFLGLVQHEIKDSVTRRVVVEYVFLGLCVLTLLLVSLG